MDIFRPLGLVSKFIIGLVLNSRLTDDGSRFGIWILFVSAFGAITPVAWVLGI